MSFTIGENCDFILIHPEVNNGDPYGFVIAPDPSKSGPAFSVQRSLNDDDEVVIYLFATIILADDLQNPDGSEHSASKQTMYDMIQDYLEYLEDITIQTVIGTFLGLGQIGHTATELHLVESAFLSLKFYNVSTYHPPMDIDTYFLCIWQDTTPTGDALTWETSYWL